MESNALRLSEMVCARVCHDLGGLIGTLAGTMQLVSEERGGEAVAVACEATDLLSNRFRLLLATFGPVSDALDAPGIASLAAGLGERLRVDVSRLGPGPLAGEQVRLLLAMLLLGTEALPLSGTVQLSKESGGVLRVAALGPRAAWHPCVIQGVAGAAPTEPGRLLAPLCALFARAAGMTLAVENAPPALRAAPLSPPRG